LKDPAEHGI